MEVDGQRDWFTLFVSVSLYNVAMCAFPNDQQAEYKSAFLLLHCSMHKYTSLCL